jgi:hypothetical protein
MTETNALESSDSLNSVGYFGFDTSVSALRFGSSVRHMGMVARLRRPTISAKVIKELLKLGYLQPAKRHKPHVVERALLRLRADLVRGGVVYGGNTGDRTPPTAADDPQPMAPSRSIATS